MFSWDVVKYNLMSVDVDVFIYFYTNTTFSLVKHSMKEKEKNSLDLSNLMLKQSITNPWKFVWRRLHSAVTAWQHGAARDTDIHLRCARGMAEAVRRYH